MGMTFLTRNDSVDSAFRAVAGFALSYLHESVSSTELFYLPDKELIACSDLVLCRSVDGNILLSVLLLSRSLFINLGITFSASPGAYRIATDTEGLLFRKECNTVTWLAQMCAVSRRDGMLQLLLRSECYESTKQGLWQSSAQQSTAALRAGSQYEGWGRCFCRVVVTD